VSELRKFCYKGRKREREQSRKKEVKREGKERAVQKERD
jgi:hypothetical protein